MAAESANGLIPPSTLAAQLVENISASAKSAKSDENTELKGLFAVIQRVKDRPDLLKTSKDRIEHNHLLIYVYCRVVLENAHLDDPFLDRGHLRAETLKAINFLRFTIKETPSVISFSVPGDELLFRGREPLWAWLLPHLLRMLGHVHCIELEASIEGFIQYILAVISRTGSLWTELPRLGQYLRSIFTGLLDRLQDASLHPSRGDTTCSIELPPVGTMSQILSLDDAKSIQRVTYIVDRPTQALRQAASFARILAYPLTAQDMTTISRSSVFEAKPWLLDSLLDLSCAQKRWDSVLSQTPIPLIDLVLDLLKPSDGSFQTPFENRDKAYTLLVLLCSELVSSPGNLISFDPTSKDTRLRFCLALVAIAQGCMQSQQINRLTASKLVNELSLLSTQYPEIGTDTDVWRCNSLLLELINKKPGQYLEESLRPSQFNEPILAKAIANLELPFAETEQEKPVTKRRKLGENISHQVASTKARLSALLDPSSTSVDDLLISESDFLDHFQHLDEKTQCQSIELLSQICCETDLVMAPDQGSDMANRDTCAICTSSKVSRDPLDSSDEKTRVRLMFSRVIRSENFSESKLPRISAMVALRRLVLHCEDSEFLNLETSEAGRWCLQSLNSSLRELRIAAGRTLSVFLQASRFVPTTSDLLHRNKTNAIAVLRTLSEQSQPHLSETCILAWGQLGLVLVDDELNLVLIKLLEYLGSSNSMVSSFAFNELLNLSEGLETYPRRLFEPFWGSLAYLATKDMVHRPQRSRAMAELLQVSVTDLLLLIQTHALPWLVLDKQKEVIQKIADARQEREIWRPVMDSANLAAVLSLLLIQETEDIDDFVKSRLNDISPHFHDLSLLQLLQSEPVLIAMELLKAAGDAEPSRQASIHRALQLMATMIMGSNKDTRQKKGNVVGRFLQSYILGLMARLTDVINDSVSSQPPVVEQRRCIRALEEMIKVCKSYARIARPQIAACLLSSLTHEALREVSFSCWAAMVSHFDEDDAQALMDTSFYIVGHYWSSLNPSTAVVARDMLYVFFDRYETLVQQHINSLPSISHLTGHDAEKLGKLLKSYRSPLSPDLALRTYAQRIGHDYSGVVHQALTETVSYLKSNQSALYASTGSQRPERAITMLIRALLDCACKYNSARADIAQLCAEAIGLIGCLDSNQVEAVREQRSIVVLANFEKAEETTEFALFILQEVLVPAFLSATDTKLQGFLSYAMQELLERCDIKAACAMEHTRMAGGSEIYRKWLALPENIRQVATPFLTSRYMVAPMAPLTVEYPLFRSGKPYGNWVRSLVIDLLRKGQNPMAELIFEPLTRVIRVKDLTVAEFLLPYLVLHVLLGNQSTKAEQDNILNEMMSILQHQPTNESTYMEREDMKRYCHAIFRILDYALRWIQVKRSSGRLNSEEKQKVHYVQSCMDIIPAELIAQRAVDCNEFSRALFHLEQHAQKAEQQESAPGERSRLLERLQDIYANIDEPDGLEGISAHLHALDINQQILSHKKAGRWTAAQTWYEMQLAEDPGNSEVQIDLLNCLKQAGQHDVLLNHIEGLPTDASNVNKIMPYAVEGAWVTSRWESLDKFIQRFNGDKVQDFNMSIASLLSSLADEARSKDFTDLLESVRGKIASSMTSSTTTSLQAAHDQLLRCHVLADLELIVSARDAKAEDRRSTMTLLDARLQVMGAYFNDKQYVLGVQRAAMQLLRPSFSDVDISSLWLSSARLARKTNSLHQSFNAVLHASKLGDDGATIENAKLLWRDNHHRKAIQTLQGAIERNKFMTQTGVSSSTNSAKLTSHQKILTARAQLLLAKWLDQAGQTHASALREKYQQPPKTHITWEKGHYYLGRHYKKILESEIPLKADDQSDNYVTGEIARLVIENYVRSLNCGSKYLYQTLPRILTLWLDLGAQVDKPPDGKASLSRELHRRRVEQLNLVHTFLDKYIHRLPAYVFYTALPQIVARIAHPNSSVFERLNHIIVKVVEAHPRQALWSVIGMMTSKQVSERKARGTQVVMALRNASKKVTGTSYDLKTLLRMGEKLAEQLLMACQNGDFHGNKTVHASLTRDLRFNHKCTPCPLVVPVEASLTATLPTVSDFVKRHVAFDSEVVSIHSFLDEVLVLSSLAKPRRLTARGSDGKNYMLLIKPKDDLRTDQRLMEFNGMINRSLKRDAESSRRQLYIRTYAVVPLNEECGIIEWVPGIKTMRDILLNLYGSQKIYPDYVALKQLMDEAGQSESKIRIFTNDVLGRFPPVLHLWFIQQFPSPSAWFAARLRYTRSCAVMSMVGTILGLGDRHGENVNLEEGNGGIFHVDFNCLFDKGLTFAKPERVPFRLTHNMVAAMGIYGYEGPFRKSSELTLSILRQQEETLMTILEAFIYDPTLDLQKEKRTSRRSDIGVKLQPQSVVDSIKRKVMGLLPNESIPLGVEGQVDELIKQAVDPRNLTAMYIGWCPFL